MLAWPHKANHVRPGNSSFVAQKEEFPDVGDSLARVVQVLRPGLGPQLPLFKKLEEVLCKKKKKVMASVMNLKQKGPSL